jgi:putative oxidoreductase
MAQSASITTNNIFKTKKVSLAETLYANAHWLLRLSLSSVFVYHGFNKFVDLDKFASMMNLPYSIALLVALAELGGGILVFVGAFTKDWITRAGAAMFIPVMLGAISMIHWPQWSFVPSPTHPMGGMEFQVVLLLLSFYIVIKGNNPE